MAASADDAIRERLSGRYEFLEPLDVHGASAVYKVRDRARDSIRALKVLTGEAPNVAALLARFRREAELGGEIRNRNIARVQGFQELGGGAACLEMELVEGPTLDRLVTASRRPGVGLAIEIAFQALQALGALHRRRLAHCDVSPDNLMLTADDGGEPLVKLLDLGVAAELGEVPAGGFPGKPEYAPPEKLEPPPRPIEAADDLYALAVVLYELVTGSHPFPDRAAAAGGRDPREFARTDPGGRVPAELRQILLRALAAEPRQRFASATELLDVLAQLAARHPYAAGDLERALAPDAGAGEEAAAPADRRTPQPSHRRTPQPPHRTPQPRRHTPKARQRTPTVPLWRPLDLARRPPEPEPPSPKPAPPPPKPAPPPPRPAPPPPSPSRLQPRPAPRPDPGGGGRAWLWLALAGAGAAVAGYFLWPTGDDVTPPAPQPSPAPAVTYELTVDKAGAGSGTVTSSPGGIDCGSDCRGDFGEGLAVALTATADEDSRFAGWTPELAGDRLTLDGDRTVTALFEPQPAPQPAPPPAPPPAPSPTPPPTPPPAPPATYTLTVVKAGSGRVWSEPVGIDCGAECRESFPADTVVELFAEPAQGFELRGWRPALPGGKTTLTADRSFTVTFEPVPKPAPVPTPVPVPPPAPTPAPVPAPVPPPVPVPTPPVETFTLTIKRRGGGSGRVTSSPGKIDCGEVCEDRFEDGTAVVLSAAADEGSVFESWSPGLSDGTVTLTADRVQTARFEPAPDLREPAIELLDADYPKKKESAVLLFRITDDRGVVEATGNVRLGGTEEYRAFPLRQEAEEENVFILSIPEHFHQGRDLYYWVEAEDAAGNSGRWPSREDPEKIERNSFIKKFGNNFQNLIDKVRGKD